MQHYVVNSDRSPMQGSFIRKHLHIRRYTLRSLVQKAKIRSDDVELLHVGLISGEYRAERYGTSSSRVPFWPAYLYLNV